jgi:hypothetical protein
MLILILRAMKCIDSYNKIWAASWAADCKICGPKKLKFCLGCTRGHSTGSHAMTITKLNFQPKVQVTASKRPSSLRSKKSKTTLLLKLYRFGNLSRHRSVFSWYHRTNTKEKLGRYITVLFFSRNPFFPQKGGHGPPFEGPSPHFKEKRVSRQTLTALQLMAHMRHLFLGAS